ncbi:hypothetical protein PSEUBRA_000774 [Kalmanozyma brasiliensis GHG001]|uniref:Uncharacterized protein n=1 Tax=Kalmanozyma brasiliensis (strain GHG001) TaxID=1365824 RepID=V5GUK0_KALBG|nr:uncharacterized protein PSEUBRA_000774 [Kalmanozyma brasiliensis GHG001]EST09557.1 hypothetical protein PSEUBRA_000774 [Kalmanozyma brasiliensis GHG001]
MSQSQQPLYATVRGEVVSFPAFVRLPSSARPESTFIRDGKQTEPVKCITMTASMNGGFSDRTCYKKQIAARWNIEADAIRAVLIDLDGERVLIEDMADWHSWAKAYFFQPQNYSIYGGRTDKPSTADFTVKPIYIDVVMDNAEGQTPSSAAEESAATSKQEEDTDPAEQLPTRAPHDPTRSTASSLPGQQRSNDPIGALVNNIMEPVFQSLQPQIRDLVDTLAGSIAALSAQVTQAHNQASTSNTTPHPRFTFADQPTDAHVPAPAASESSISAGPEPTLPREAAGETQRQSLIDGLFDELSSLRAQRGSTSAAAPSSRDTATGSTGEGEMRNELTSAFAEMIAHQRSAATRPVDDDEESLTIVSTPSASSRASRSRSRSRSRRTSLLGSTTLTVLTLLTFILTFISPTVALTALNPNPLTSRSASSLAPQSSRNLHLCKCTCFQTNSTLVPLYSPADPSKPCLTCTRQFCLDQGLDVCKGAKLEHTDHDVGTGFEGDVWAKCFERDSFKDQGIITLYILTVVGLVGFAAMRGRVEGWMGRYQGLGSQGLYEAVRGAPWMRGSR